MKTNLIIIGVALCTIIVSNGLTHSVMRKEVEKVKVERDSIITLMDSTKNNLLVQLGDKKSDIVLTYLEALSSLNNGDHDEAVYNIRLAKKYGEEFELMIYNNLLNN